MQHSKFNKNSFTLLESWELHKRQTNIIIKTTLLGVQGKSKLIFPVKTSHWCFYLSDTSFYITYMYFHILTICKSNQIITWTFAFHIMLQPGFLASMSCHHFQHISTSYFVRLMVYKICKLFFSPLGEKYKTKIVNC